MPVIMTIAEQSTPETIGQVKLAEENGDDGFIIFPPMRYKSTHEDAVEFCKNQANSTPLPIMIYNNPIDFHCAKFVCKRRLHITKTTAKTKGWRFIDFF